MSITWSVFDGVPTFFRVCCLFAQHEWDDRGRHAEYSRAGLHLGRALHRLAPYSPDEGDWEAEVNELYSFLEAKDFRRAMKWLVVHYPACLALVPDRQRPRRVFLKGVYLAWLIDTNQCARSDARKRVIMDFIDA